MALQREHSKQYAVGCSKEEFGWVIDFWKELASPHNDVIDLKQNLEAIMFGVCTCRTAGQELLSRDSFGQASEPGFRLGMQTSRY